MFVYRLAAPIDEFDDFVDLPTWLNNLYLLLAERLRPRVHLARG